MKTNLSLRSRLLFATVPASLLLLAMILYFAVNEFVLSVKMDFIRDMARLVQVGSASIHDQQLERDAALLYLADPSEARREDFKDAIETAKASSDRANALILSVNWARYSKELDEQLKKATAGSGIGKTMSQLREEVLGQAVGAEEVAAQFNTSQQNSLKPVAGMLAAGLFPQELTVIELVNRLKEAAGRERVYIAVALTQNGVLNDAAASEVNALAGEQSAYLRAMAAYAERDPALREALAARAFNEAESLRRRLLAGEEVSAERWYAVSTERIEKLKSLNDTRVQTLMEKAVAGSQVATLRFVLSAIVGLLVIVATTWITIRLIRQITRSAAHLSGVMDQIAAGNLSARVQYDLTGEFDAIGRSVRNTIVTWNDVLLRLRTAINQIQTGSSHISDAAGALSSGATEQAASIEEITAAISELSSQSRRTVEHCEQANRIAGRARVQADSGEKLMEDMVTAMQKIHDSSQSIARILKSIDEIAFQTNLLALNAAVEAARAGVHGKGFTVVAEEVKNLSVRSSQAARETADLIEQSIQRANGGVDIAEKTATALKEISHGVQESSGLLEEISVAAREQVAGIGQIEQSIQQIEQVIQQTAASAEENAATSEEFLNQSRELADQVARFQLGDDAPDADSGSHAPSGRSPRNGVAAAPAATVAARPAEYAADRGLRKSPAAKTEPRPEDVISLEDRDFDGF